MNQKSIGEYIATKRKEKNLTQEQLAEKLNVSNKSISKWENGKCMPDYSIIEKLCLELSISLNELMDGKDTAQGTLKVCDDNQLLDLLRRTQELEKQKEVLYGILLIVLGIASNSMPKTISGNDVKDFIAGLLMGLAIVEMIAGIVIIGKKTIEK